MITLDTRDLEHPYPLEMAVDAFKNLKNNEIVHMIHRKEPLPLFEIIVKNGGRYLCHSQNDELFHIYFTKSSTIELEHIDV